LYTTDRAGTLAFDSRGTSSSRFVLVSSESVGRRSEVEVFGLGPTELIIMIVVALIVFGPTRLPKIGKMLGESMGNYKKFKSSTDDLQKNAKKSLEDMVLGPPENN
jgi:sec-independent protein translocase protein TatA